MPYAAEVSERAKAVRRHPDWSDERIDAYTYAVLRKKYGWKPGKGKR